jgi:hypothetical protein
VSATVFEIAAGGRGRNHSQGMENAYSNVAGNYKPVVSKLKDGMKLTI